MIAVITFLGSALAVGAAVGGGADRLSMARRREDEQRRLQELNAQIAEHASRMAVLQQVDEQRVALLRSVSHDLRTPSGDDPSRRDRPARQQPARRADSPGAAEKCV